MPADVPLNCAGFVATADAAVAAAGAAAVTGVRVAADEEARGVARAQARASLGARARLATVPMPRRKPLVEKIDNTAHGIALAVRSAQHTNTPPPHQVWEACSQMRCAFYARSAVCRVAGVLRREGVPASRVQVPCGGCTSK